MVPAEDGDGVRLFASFHGKRAVVDAALYHHCRQNFRKALEALKRTVDPQFELCIHSDECEALPTDKELEGHCSTWVHPERCTCSVRDTRKLISELEEVKRCADWFQKWMK